MMIQQGHPVTHPLLLFCVLLYGSLLLSSTSSTVFAFKRRTTTTPLKDRSEYLVKGLEDEEPAFRDFDGVMYAGLIPFENGEDTSGGGSSTGDEIRQGELMFWLFLPNKRDETSDTTSSNTNDVTNNNNNNNTNKTTTTSNDSIVLWLNGGPGCSSFDAGVYFETSPVTVPLHPAGYCCSQAHPPLGVNPHGWTNAVGSNSNAMLYIEQPAGVGFSNGPDPLSESDLAGDMHSFLQHFFSIFDDLASRDFFIFGESYAGMFVPSIARRIHSENKKLLLLKKQAADDDAYQTTTSNDLNLDDEEESSTLSPIVTIRLTGIALGNGWIDAMVQGSTAIDYAYWHGMIDSTERRTLKELWKSCQEGGGATFINSGDDSPLHAFTVPDECGIMGSVLKAAGSGLLTNREPNTYDVTTWDTYPVLVSDDPGTTFNAFFNKDVVKAALHAPLNVTWRGCIPGAGRRRRRLALLDNDTPLSVAPYLAGLMDDAKIRILIYNGDRDLSVNAPGTEMVLDQMTEWSGYHAWRRATRGLWVDDDKEMAGWAKEYNLLTYLVVYNSGHLVPHNQPKRSLQMLQRFLTNATFIDKEIPRLSYAGSSSSSDSSGTTTTTITAPSEVTKERRHTAVTWLGGLMGLSMAIVAVYRTMSLSRRQRRATYCDPDLH